MWRLSPLLLLTFFGAFGCKTVRPMDVVGTWAMAYQSRNVLPAELQKASGMLVVNADGTFKSTELPEELHPIGGTRRLRLDSGGGIWSLARWDGEQHLELEFHEIAPADTEGSRRYGFPMELSRGWSGLDLYYFLGDPDEVRRITLTRR
jgi:hypothetical protein